MSKFLLFGYGSIGHRHTQNLRRLRPAAQLVIADPYCIQPGPRQLFYRDWRRALSDHGDADGAIIASPTSEHLTQLLAADHAGISVYVEKPLLTVADYRQLAAEQLLTGLPLDARHVCGFQYLFHAAMPTVERLARQCGELTFAGSDDLLGRYGRDVEGMMVAHPIATALRLFGPAFGVHLHSDGVRLAGHVYHQSGGVSHYDFAMDRGPRESWVRAGGREVALGPSDNMYLDCMASWLDFIEGGPRDSRLSSVSEGVAVTQILAQVARVEAMV